MFEVDKVKYSLKYNIRSIKMIEGTLKKSLVAILTGGDSPFVTIEELEIMIAYGLCDANGKWIPYERAITIAQDIVLQNYLNSYETMFKRLQKDCGFLFR